MKRLLTILCLSALVAPCTFGGNNDVPRDTSFTRWGTYLHVRKKHPEVSLYPDTVPAGVMSRIDVAYTTVKDSPFGVRQLHADIFRPDDNNVYPAIIMIHGGGWNSGDKSLQRPMAGAIAARGYVAIPVEYRLIPEALYPAGLHDIKTAIRWVRKNASALGVDPARIAVSGCSAGGQLAVLAGVTNGSSRHEGDGEWTEVSSEVQAIVDMDGVSTFVSENNIADAERRLAEKGTLPISAVWLGGTYADAPENWEEASAVKWVSGKSAPVCFICSNLSRYTDGREYLIRLYDREGIHTETHNVQADIHPYWFFSQWAGTTVEIAAEFLDRIFKQMPNR